MRGAVPVYQEVLPPHVRSSDRLCTVRTQTVPASMRSRDDGSVAPSDLPRPLLLTRIVAGGAALALLLGGLGVGGSAAAGVTVLSGGSAARDLADRGWIWPSASFRLERGYEAPAHRYAAGHRGVDLRPVVVSDVRAPADGTVAFVGRVADRPVLTIDHRDGLVTTFEPIDSSLAAGDAVRSGDTVGTVALGGHSSAGALHFGVRLDGEYINPLLLLGGVPRAVLLPCC